MRNCIRHLVRLTVLVGCALQVSQSDAGQIYVNSTWVSNVVVSSTQANVRYRMSQTQYDMELANGKDNASKQVNLGNNTFLNNRTYDFKLEHRGGAVGVNNGFIWTLHNGTTNTTVSWGTFSPAVSGSVATLGGTAPGAAFNSLEITQQATRKQGAGSSITLSNLWFSGAGLTIKNGAFINSTVTTPGGGPVAAPLTQRIVSDVNLATSNWMLTGKVTGLRDFVNGDHDAVMLLIRAQQISYSLKPVPEPGSLLALILGTAGCIGYGRIRRFRAQRADRTA